MAGSFTSVDLSQLAAPVVVETLSFEAIFASMLADLRARDAAFTALVESDPAYKLLEVCAYRELLIRQRVNDGARAVMLAYAIGTDLDHIAANYNVQRLVIQAGNPDAIPPTEDVLEGDEDLRRRVQLSFEGFSTAGPVGAYIFHTLGADGRVLDASAVSPAPGAVTVTVLSREGDGTASSELLDIVEAALNADDVRPLTDNVTVQSASIQNFTIVATLSIFEGPDQAVVLANAQASAQAYVDDAHRVGRDIPRSAIFAALHVPGVQSVTLTSPASSLTISGSQAAYCSGITLTGVASSD